MHSNERYFCIFAVTSLHAIDKVEGGGGGVGERGAGGVWEGGEEGVGSGIPKVEGSG